MDDEGQNVILQGNARIDIYSYTSEVIGTTGLPVSARSFFFPTPAQFRLEENWFGVFGFHGTMIVMQCETLCTRDRTIDRNELVCRESIEWFGKSAMTRGNWLSW